MEDVESTKADPKHAFGREFEARRKVRAGYLYVLGHPGLPGYMKLGHTTKHPQARLKEHNSQRKKLLGQIAQLTGRKWQLIYYVPVADARGAELRFYSEIPRFGKIELLRTWDIEVVIEQYLKQNPYLNKAGYTKLLEDELRNYNVDAVLRSLRVEWARDGVEKACEEMLEKMQEELDSDDQY